MRRYFARIHRSAVVLAAAASLTVTVGVPSAHAVNISYSDTYCGDTEAMDGVYTRACWYQDDTGRFVPGSKMRVPNALVPSKWTQCELRFAVYYKSASATTWTRRSTGYEDCLTEIKDNSTNNIAWRQYDQNSLHWILPNSNTCYYTMVRWLAVYDGVAVGMQDASGPFAYSLNKCG